MGGKPLGPPISSGNCFTGRYSPTYRWASALFICLNIVWFFNLFTFLLIFNLQSSRLTMPKNLREKKLGKTKKSPFSILLPSWSFGQCAIRISFVWMIFIRNPNMDLIWSFFRVPDQHMRRCMTNPPVSETTTNLHYHQISWTLRGCKIYLVIK